MMEIERIMPVWKVEHGAMVSTAGDVTIAFRVVLPEIGTQSAKDFEALHQSFAKALRVLQQGTVLHKADWFVSGRFKPSGVLSDTLRGAGERAFAGRRFLEHECFIFLTRKPSGRKLSTSAYSNILRRSVVPRDVLDARSMGAFLASCGQFERILLDSGAVDLVRLDDDALAGTAAAPGIIERYCFLLGRGQRPVIRDVHVSGGIRVGRNTCELYTLADVQHLPPLCGPRLSYEPYSTDRTAYSIGFATPLGMLLDCNHIYSQYVFIGDGPRTIRELEAKKLRLQSLSGYSRENAVSRDAVNDFLNEAVATGKLPVRAHFNVLCWSEDPQEVSEFKNKVGSAMARLGAECKQETDGEAQIWFSGMPGNAADFPMNDSFDTFGEQAACFFNLESSVRCDGSGLRLADRLYGRPVYVDLFNAPMKSGLITNRNMFICGSSGAGKSVVMNHLLRSQYDEGAHCVVVDVGGSYRGLCELVGGYYFAYTQEKPICFNPFYIAEGDVLDIEKKESLKTLLLALWKKDAEDYNRSEYVAISTAITMYYEYLALNPSVFPGFNSFYEFLLSDYMQVMKDGKVKEKDFDLGSMLYVLNPYYKGGEFDYLLNASENLDLLNERFIVFELDNIRGHEILFPVVTIIIMELFISKMRKLKGLRKVLAIDEAWVAIAKSGMSHFIRYLYKTVRKFNGIAALSTQEVEDLISSPIIKETVINLSDTKVLLDMRKFMNKFDQLQEALGLSDKAKTLLLSLNKANAPAELYRELLLDQGGQHLQVYRNQLALEEYLAYTTEEAEKLVVERFAAKYGDMARGIAVLAAEIRSGIKHF